MKEKEKMGKKGEDYEETVERREYNENVSFVLIKKGKEQGSRGGKKGKKDIKGKEMMKMKRR